MTRVALVNEDRGGTVEGVAAEPERLDPSAFGLLYEKHRLAVFRYLRARTPSDDEALDLTAVTFERAFGSRGRFRRRDGGVRPGCSASPATPPSMPTGGADRRSTWQVPMHSWGRSRSKPIGSGTSTSRSSTSSPGCRMTSARPFSFDTPGG